VSVRKSTAHPNRIISMIDGKPYVSLKRHIGRHGYTPASYRETFDLPAAYPMTAVAYTEQRRAIAKRIGLGRRKADPAPISEPAPAVPTRRRLKIKTG
jgi:predicted transcriptional regulator